MNLRTVIVLVASVFGAGLSIFGFTGTVAGQVRVNEAMSVIAISAFFLAALISTLMFLVQDESSPITQNS